MHKLMLTFDIEDFVNSNEINALRTILHLLRKYRLRAVFFVTGHMAEKLVQFSDILSALKEHEIGFHSSSHSVRPTIPEYTDIKSYQMSYKISFLRETSHINPLTGAIEGEGGIYALQDTFGLKKIQSFRAPGMSWTPPHLEALLDLGVRFDFSSKISRSETFRYRGISFFPFTFLQQWFGTRSDCQSLVSALLKRKIAVFDLHPTLCVNQRIWDSIYYNSNPDSLVRVPERTTKEIDKLFSRFALLIRHIHILQKLKLIEIDSELKMATTDLTLDRNQICTIYKTSMRWPRKFFNLNPRFIHGHFHAFFESACQ